MTGLSISDNTPHAPRSFKKKLRQELYYCKKFGIKSHLLKLLGGSNEECLMGGEGIEIQRGINRIHGTVCYVSHIEESPQLLRSWFDLVKNNKCNITYVDRVNFKEVSEEYLASVNPRQEHNQEYNIVEFYIDETEIEYENERKFLAVAFTAIEQNKIQNISESIKKILEDNIADPFTGGNKTKLKKNKLHFLDADRLLQTKCIDYLSSLNYKTYIAYGTLGSSKESYKDTYINLLKEILPTTILAKGLYASQIITFNFEQNNKVSKIEIEKVVTDIYSRLVSSSSKRPLENPTVNIITKNDHYCLTMPDFMLGIFNQYAKKQNTENCIETRRFEQLRDKYTLILDTDNNVRFTRKWYFNGFNI